MSRRHSVVVGMLVVGLVTAAAAPAMAEAPVRTYEVTITNNTEGQPLTPALVATHNRRDGLFRQGRAASLGLQQIAENGNLDPMLARLDRDRDFFDVELGFGASAPPVMPGESVSVTIDARYPYRYLSFVSMLICSNDGFAGISSVRLPIHVGHDRAGGRLRRWNGAQHRRLGRHRAAVRSTDRIRQRWRVRHGKQPGAGRRPKGASSPGDSWGWRPPSRNSWLG